MPYINRKVPFRLTPGSWGLKGKTFKKAEAEYYWDGEELDRRLTDIEHPDDPENSYKHLELDKKYGHINDYDYKKKKLDYQEFNYDSDKELARLKIEYDYGNMDENEYNKSVANQKNEPWVGVISTEFDPNSGVNGLAWELDWNEQFVQMLRNEGYQGHNDSQVVEAWFNDLCTAEAIEQGIMDDLTGTEEPVQSGSAATTRKFVDDSGKTSYS